MTTSSNVVRYVYEPEVGQPGVAVEVIAFVGDRALVIPYGPANGPVRFVPASRVKK